MIYCMDTSAFIALERDYSHDVFPSLWDDFIISLVKENRLIASEEVKEELKRKDNDLVNWVKRNCNEVFAKTDIQILEHVKDIMNRFPNLINSDNPSRNQADPFVIALALKTRQSIKEEKRDSGLIVITYENFTGNLGGPKMPDICRYFKVRVGKLIDIFKIEGWKIGV